MLFKAGDEVKLTHRYASVLLRSKRTRQDWLTRKGVVCGATSKNVTLVWQGNHSTEYLPACVLELIK